MNNTINIKIYTLNSIEIPISFILRNNDTCRNDYMYLIKEILDDIIESFDPDTEGKDSTALNIIIIDNECLTKSEFYEALITFNNPLNNSSQKQTISNSTRKASPIIFIGTDDIMELEEDPSGQNSYFVKNQTREIIRRQIDPRYRFLDSSIWHRYVNIYPHPDKFKERLKSIIQEIINYNKSDLYNAITSIEHLEFQYRKLRNSYLANIEGGHSNRVTPYRFHSESRMKAEADKLFEKTLKDFSWGCLLIDDYYQSPLRAIGDKTKPGPDAQSTKNKSKLIASILNNNCPEDNPLIRILNAAAEDPKGKYLNEGKKWLTSKYSFVDVVILDYFFGASEQSDEERYGHHLIRDIVSNGPNTFPSAAFNKHWIFPISVFDHAFQSHLLTLGQSQIDEKIVLGEGADPVNTPELFRYLFFQFLEAHLNTNGVKLEIIAKEILAKFEDSKKKLGISDDNLKLAVTERYHEIVALSSGLNKIRQAANTSSGPASVFASTYLQKIDPNKNLVLLCNQIQQLAYLIAYGNAVEWPRMWEKLLATKTILNNTSIKREYFDKLLNEINTYIIELSKIT